MCSPRPPGQQLRHARLGQSSPAPRLVFSRWRSSSAAPLTRRFSTASRPATHPPRRLGRCCHGAPASRQVSSSATVPRPAAPPCTPRPVFTGATASIFPMALFLGGASHKALLHGVPASNKPHPAEKSTPVWLAIWRTWAGFANSQLRRAAFRSIYLYRCAHSSCFHLGAAAQTDANLSAHMHRLPTPPPYLRQMRLSHGRVRGCWVLDETSASQGRRC